jgi:hypothetical protein
MFKHICKEDVEAWASNDCPAPAHLINKAREYLGFEYSDNDLERYDQVVNAWKAFSKDYTLKKDLDLTQVYDDVADLPRLFAAAVSSHDLEKSVELVLKRYGVLNPRIPSRLSVIQEVLDHFHKHKPVSLRVLSLYCKKLQVSPAELLALLSSGSEFYTMPSVSVSYVRGRPCRIRTGERYKNAKKGKNWNKPSVLISSGKLTMYRDNKVVAECAESGLLAPFPTDNRLEQVVLCMKPSGEACLITTTANSMRKVVDFDVPTEGLIDWVDVRKDKSSHILYWGGTDHMLGGSTWQYCLGVDAELNFFEVKADHADKVYDSQKLIQDFSLHGNILTMHRSFQDVEDQVRKYKGSTTILCNDGIVEEYGLVLIDAWGTPQNHVVLLDHALRIYTERDMVETEVHVDRDASLCVLYAHSR